MSGFFLRVFGVFLMFSSGYLVCGKEADTILYVDVNGTIMIGDGARGKSLTSGVYQAAASRLIDQWHEDNVPMSLENYVKTCLVGQREKFLNESYLALLEASSLHHLPAQTKDLQAALFEKIPEILSLFKPKLGEEKFQRYMDFINKLKLKGEKFHEGIAPSFINFVENLIPVTKLSIVISTFGKEGKDVLKTLSQLSECSDLPCFPAGEFENGQLKLEDGQVLSTHDQISTFMSQVGLHVVRNNYKEWNDSGRLNHKGKPMYVTPDKLVLFFDDNALNEKGESCIACMAPDGTPLSLNSLMDKKLIVKVDVVDVIENEGYFFEKYARACEEKNQK